MRVRLSLNKILMKVVSWDFLFQRTYSSHAIYKWGEEIQMNWSMMVVDRWVEKHLSLFLDLSLDENA